MWGCGFVKDGQSKRGSVWLWVCEGWPVKTWQCLVVGLFRWGLCVWDCGGGVVVCFRRKRRKESREKRRRNREMNNTKKEKRKKEKKRKGEREMNKK